MSRRKKTIEAHELLRAFEEAAFEMAEDPFPLGSAESRKLADKYAAARWAVISAITEKRGPAT